MNVRGAAVQSGLAALGLVVAYTTWQREPERAPGESVVLDLNKGDLSKIRFDDGAGKWAELTRKKDARDEEPRVWLRLSGDDKKKQPERELPGNDGAGRLWEKFAPLRATRALGVLKADKLKELGLDGAKKKLEVTARGDKHVYLVATPPAGVSEPYVKDEKDGHVYVLGGGVISDLDSAGVRFVDRALHGWKPGEFDGVTVSAGGKSRALSAPPSDNPMNQKFLNRSGKPDDLVKNWHDKVWRQSVVEVLGKGENPAAGAPSPECKVEYTWRGKAKGFLELARLPGAAPANTSSAQPVPPDIWARSEHTAGWVKLPSSADDVLKECAKVAAGE